MLRVTVDSTGSPPTRMAASPGAASAISGIVVVVVVGADVVATGRGVVVVVVDATAVCPARSAVDVVVTTRAICV